MVEATGSPRHDHIRFNKPPEVRLEIDQEILSNDDATTSATSAQ